MIKLKSLIRINEQAPQPMPVMGGGMGTPVPMGAPPAPEVTPAPEEQPITPETDTTPAPEDPGEYDWTKDFRAFEDAKNKAEAQAKKKLLDKMNKSLIGKKVTTNASRGYGQPKTDHTIDNVKKVNVEFWYKEWVVILQDENDKKYFLTPGVNIKIEQGSEEPVASDDQAPVEPEAGQAGATGEEEPNAVPAGPETGAMPGAEAMPPAPGGELPPDQSAAAMGPAPVPGAPPPAPPAPVAPPSPAPVNPLKKKKKLAEEINKDLKSFLSEYMINENTDFTQYIKGIKSAINESRGASVHKVRLEIPVDHMKRSTDIRDIQLSAKNALWESGNVCQRFNRGSVNISKVGRLYLMEYVKETGWK